METNDYRQQPWMRRGSKGRAQWTTSMCPNCGAEPKFSGEACDVCGCLEAVTVYICDVRYLQKMIADYDGYTCACYGEYTRPADEQRAEVILRYYGLHTYGEDVLERHFEKMRDERAAAHYQAALAAYGAQS